MSATSSLDDDGYDEEMEIYGGGNPYHSYSASAHAAPAVDSKGKGRGGDDAAQGGSKDGSIQDKLNKVQSIDDRTISALVAHDPTPLGSLSTSAKVMRALVALQELFAPEILDTVRQPPPSSSPLPSPPPRNLPMETFTTISQLLSSVLADINQSSPPSRHTYELNAARAQLALRQHGHATPFDLAPPPPSSVPRTQQSDKDDRTLSELMAENVRLMLIQLRPPLLDSPPPTSPTSPTDLIRLRDPSATPIGQLPPEILARIFEIARREAEQPNLTGELGHRYDDFGVLRPSCMPIRPQPGQPFELSGSRTLAQRFAHSLALVCKDWKAVARPVAFSSVHLSRRTQLDKLLDLLMASDNTYATHIRSINAKVPVQLPDVDAMGDISGTRTRRGGAFVLPIFRGRGQAGWSGAGPSTDRQGADDAIETQGALFQKLVTASTNLKTLSLTVLGHAFSSPFGGRHAGADFLDPVILATLSSIPTLRTLTLGTSIDFEELEVIMLGLPLLEELRLDGGFDSIDGRGAVSSTSPHLARLRKLTVGDGQQVPRDFSSVSDVQLAWLLEPAARSLHVLDITVMSMNPNAGFGAGGWGGGGGGGAQAPPFASGLFADMLVLMGPTLERLAIKDAQGGGALYPSLNNAPHNGTLDYALSFCTSLHDLVIQFQYTGPALLDSLRSSPSLESLFFLGPPTGTSAGELARRIEGGDQFGKLQRVIVSGQFGGRGVLGGGGWLGADVRRLKNVCAEAKVYCLVASS